ncbi:MAG: Peptidase S26B, signal peptidase [candidate division WWE3 bacterium GW2011_GWE1_41_27]|uniref:Signal peptidase I n=2 Tax=Katanobacteria TaxID=422282 RepID=A0A0G1AGQ9_UNCKA|nr:MAG: Peptidase S26B, signal peptidase [candidate division WWE3 bacterium GW2011_GWE1_41_27]KKS60129.1 MAG: Peptidase S26B, signal peptidase [candidate division WWE3 bacterium GW2011_GWF2_42_42]
MDRYYTIIFISLLVGAAKLSGVSLFYVLTGSMIPAIGNGDVVVTVPVRKIKNGDIISFKQNSVVVTHRVTEIQRTPEGAYFSTKGDNNEHSDAFPVSEQELMGKVIFVIPAGHVVNQKNVPVLYWLLGFTFGLLIHRIHIQNTPEL